MNVRVLLGILTALLAGTVGLAAEGKPGLKVGNDLPGSFHPYNVVNSRYEAKYEGKFHCLVCEHGLKPGVLLFIRNADLNDPKWKPVVDLLKDLDKYVVAASPRNQLRAFAVFLFDDRDPKIEDVVTNDDEREARAAELRKFHQAHGMKEMVLALDGAAALQKHGYDLDPSTGVLVILYNNLKIRNIYPFPPGALNESNVKTIMDEIKEQLAPIRKPPVRPPTGRALGGSSRSSAG